VLNVVAVQCNKLNALQEYLGAYSADDKGNLVFHEGALVRAARNGDWVILDELNLAPTDVLEALNRLFDDNHELFVPELQEAVKPHPQFMLFGTQNPAGAYAGVHSNRLTKLHMTCSRTPGER
jgi:midasin